MKYYIGNIGASSLLNITGYRLNAILMFTGPWFCKKLGVVSSIILGFGVSILGQFIIYFGQTNLPIVLLGTVLLNGFSALPSGLLFILAPDAVNDGLVKTGQDITGFVFSTLSFSSKLGMAVGGMLCSFFMVANDYTSYVETQGEAFVQSLRQFYLIVPLICSFLCILLLLFYRKTGTDYFSNSNRRAVH